MARIIRIMGYIYKITNDINNKIYIGQTVNSIYTRFNQHIYCAQKNKPDILYDAMRKYGIEHFFVEKIEECEPFLLDIREIYWINYYDSYNTGYNLTLGGNARIAITDDEILREWYNGLTVNQIVTTLHVDSRRIKEVLNKNHITYQNILNRSGHSCIDSKLVSTLWNQGYGITEILSKTKGSIEKLHKVLNELGITEQMIKERAFKLKSQASQQHTKKVSQYSLDNQYITTYNSLNEAAKAVGLKTTGNISSCCNGKRKTAGGYKWKLGEQNELSE